MSKPALLTLTGVSKRYGKIQANRNIDLSVKLGSIHAVLGENGAGKSTLMKLIYGIEQPDEGTIAWEGKPISLSRPSEAQALGIGMVFQHFSLFETLSVVQNVSLMVPGRLNELADRITELGEQFGLSVDPHAMVHTMSVGERQRVEIIRCLLLNPKVLILDEPTSVLPPQSVRMLFDTLRRLQAEGMAVLFISHKLEEIRELCDEATILRHGEVTGRVDPREHDAHSLAKMMIGRDMPHLSPGTHATPGEVRLVLNDLSHPRATRFGTSLEKINLSLRSGEIIGIAGISGNGQQELAALVSGETRAGDAAMIEIMGRPVGHLGPLQRRKLGFAFVPEERLGRGSVPEMTLSDNSLLTAHSRGMLRGGFIRRQMERAFTRDCIKAFDVRTPGIDAEAGALSGGNLQKFILGREIMLAPGVMLVAQPTWGVDVGAATAIRLKLLEMRDQGAAILVISEELEELFEICDTLHVLRAGHLSPPLPAAETSARDVGAYMIGAAA
ncbi:ABC transporter ATP-binding protein [Hoeflea prorocentri]|uniref:ABC transporter ATP-binding protein n=1 Tax=Hoeflea prorocentri TaxID=1922333 RepID=A0A9X3ZGN5_9HYPH|nr:ABC transporter ATP-binding protein [Hoeflea prorocentri]MCY6380083.1 ABC transporter ATP-binding protein [Hoeflea prorocentri]MDA5397883.1 ABC transporter ATP-binding protein [Hoeflea prorocentri]